MSSDLNKRIVLTIFILLIISAMAIVPIPGINAKALLDFFNSSDRRQFFFPPTFLMGAFRRATISALGIGPYISASIITIVILYLLKFRKGIDPRSVNVAGYTIGLTIFFCIQQSYGIATFLENIGTTSSGLSVVPHPGIGFRCVAMLTMTTTTLLIVWLAYIISRKGVGNGICLIILIGILSKWLHPILTEIGETLAKNRGFLTELGLLTLFIGLFFLSVWIIQAKQKMSLLNDTDNSKLTNEPNIITNITLRFNTMGVFPITFIPLVLSVIAMALFQISSFFQSSFSSRLSTFFSFDSVYYWIFLFVLLPFCVYFWVAVAYNPNQLIRTLKRFYGSKIDGDQELKIKARLDRFLIKMTLPYYIFLLSLLVFPLLLKMIGKTNFKISATTGTTVVVVIAIMLDILRQYKSFQVMRQHRTRGKETGGYFCNICKETIDEKETFCHNCGAVFTEQYNCSTHSEKQAEGICVVCRKPLCQICSVDNKGRVCCEEHANLEIIEGWAIVNRTQTKLEAALFKEKLEKEKIPCEIVSNTMESMYGTLGFWEISPVIPFAVHRELGGGETKVMVPMDQFEIVNNTTIFETETDGFDGEPNS